MVDEDAGRGGGGIGEVESWGGAGHGSGAIEEGDGAGGITRGAGDVCGIGGGDLPNIASGSRGTSGPPGAEVRFDCHWPV